MRRNLIASLSLALMMFALVAAPARPAAAQVAVGFAVRFGPPPLRAYAQPFCPAPGYLWVPGYWAWDGEEYVWVPGMWMQPPAPGLLWTPGYWGWRAGFYDWHPGYWGPRVGFYGGINYGFGYPGVGYEGGYWRGRVFYYNRAVNRVNVTVIHNVYRRTVIVNRSDGPRVSYNGGPGGIAARPDAAALAAARERRFGETTEQTRFAAHARGMPRPERTAPPNRVERRGEARPPRPNGRKAQPPKLGRRAKPAPRRERQPKRGPAGERR